MFENGQNVLCKITFGKINKNGNFIVLIHKNSAAVSMIRVFKALGIATATLDLGVAGKVALW